MVGDRSGNLWAFHLSNGSSVRGWPAHTGGAHRLDALGDSRRVRHRHRLRRRRQCRRPDGGGLLRLRHTRAARSGVRTLPIPTGPTACRHRWLSGTSNGVNAVVAPSLGQDEYAFNAGNGTILPGWPFFTADSGFTTPSLADLYGNGQTEVVEGGDSSPGSPTARPTRPAATCGSSGRVAISSATTTPTRRSTPRPRWATSWPAGRPASPSAPGRTTPEPRTPTRCSGRTPPATSPGGPTSAATRPAARPSVTSRATATSRSSRASDTGSGGLVWALNGSNGAAVAGMAPGHLGHDHRRHDHRRPHRGRLQRRPGPDLQRPGHLRRPERPGGGHPRRQTPSACRTHPWSPSIPTEPSGSPSPATTARTPASSSTTRSAARRGTRWASGHGRCSTRTPS